MGEATWFKRSPGYCFCEVGAAVPDCPGPKSGGNNWWIEPVKGLSINGETRVNLPSFG